jgi:phage terminase large subunit GpA-like protein
LSKRPTAKKPRSSRPPTDPPTSALISEEESDRRMDEAVARAMRAWRPPPKLSLSEWADRHFVLSAESAAEPGRWKSLPYQRGIMDAITDPRVEHVTVMKSARVGYTSLFSAAIGYFMHQDPTTILVVQPTVEDAKNFSKETIASMLRDVPVLSTIAVRDLEERGPKSSSNTITHKAFPGGVLSLIGANSGSGFRRISRRVVLFDEVDCYPPSAGSEGDPIELGKRRSETYWNRKLVDGSTPLLAGSSRIAELFEAGDQRRYYVPCPHCGHMDFLVFREGPRGHHMAWPEGKPEEAYFVCSKNGCVIEHKHKREMVERGEWRADGEFHGHASFHIWAAYSYSPNSTWGHIAKEFTAANKAGPLKLQTFVNTVLGETWTERGEAPDWLRLYQRREHYPRATVPAGVIVLTAGVDVQRDRLVVEVVGWGEDRQSWSVEFAVLPGDTAGDVPWRELDELLARGWPGAEGGEHHIRCLAVDSGDQTQRVYGWARRHGMPRVIAVKGQASARAIIGTPSAVDVTVNGRKLSRGFKVWMVGVSILKSELYGLLRLEPPTKEGEPFPAGYCHFPEYGEDFFKELTAEHLVTVTRRNGTVVHEWQPIAGRQNHALDARCYARAAAALVGLDRYAAKKRKSAPAPAPTTPKPAASGEPATPASPPPAAPPAPPPPAAPPPQPAARERPRGGFLGGRFGGRGSWLGRR